MPQNFNSPKDVIEHYQLHYHINEFIDFSQIPPLTVPDWFKSELRFSLLHRGEDDKEAFTSEFIIVPFLKEVWKRHPQLNLFSHVPIKSDDIMVIPDYLLTSPHPMGYKTVCKPLLLTVEANNEKFEEGWTQALLQSIVCQKINGTDDSPVLAIVTTGDLWQFGKLEKQVFTKHPVPSSIQHVGELLGILDTLFAECEKFTLRKGTIET